MDSIEIARQSAALLHTSVREEGSELNNLYEFALAAASIRNIDVETTSPGAAILNNSQATYLASDGLILLADTGSDFDRAFLVAHELGHAELGDTAGYSMPATVDPARPAEQAPVGFDRVVDYGRRQRREVQMDLFARELLLPRRLLRQLHVEEGFSASEIATRFQAPFEVVAQQLFDACLLPPIVSEPKKEAEELPPNPVQKRAAEHRGVAYLLEAGPGTGKTQTLVMRINMLLEEKVDPRRILVLTFSNKAAGEMIDRVAGRYEEAAASIWIGTFHAFGLDLIHRFYGELLCTHDVIRRIMERIVAGEIPASDLELNEWIGEGLTQEGLSKHGYLEEFHAVAHSLLTYLLTTTGDQEVGTPEQTILSFPSGEVVVEQTAIAIVDGGQSRFRTIKTGHQRAYEKDSAETFALIEAARINNVLAELVHLADQTITPLSPPRDLPKKLLAIDGLLRSVREGSFEAHRSSRTCPGCPAFFVCGEVPVGGFFYKTENR